jgi:hypothetical protein
MNKDIKKIQDEHFFISFLDQKVQLLNPSSKKDLKAAGEAFSRQKRTSSTLI